MNKTEALDEILSAHVRKQDSLSRVETEEGEWERKDDYWWRWVRIMHGMTTHRRAYRIYDNDEVQRIA